MSTRHRLAATRAAVLAVGLFALAALMFSLGCERDPASAAADPQNAPPGTFQLALHDVMPAAGLAIGSTRATPAGFDPDSLPEEIAVFIYRDNAWHKVTVSDSSVYDCVIAPDGAGALCVGIRAVHLIDFATLDVTTVWERGEALLRLPCVASRERRQLLVYLTILPEVQEQGISYRRLIFDVATGNLLSECRVPAVTHPVFAGDERFLMRQQQELVAIVPDCSTTAVGDLPSQPHKLITASAENILWLTDSGTVMLGDQRVAEVKAETRLVSTPNAVMLQTGDELLTLVPGGDTLITAKANFDELVWFDPRADGTLLLADTAGRVVEAGPDAATPALDLRPLPLELRPLPVSPLPPVVTPSGTPPTDAQSR